MRPYTKPTILWKDINQNEPRLIHRTSIKKQWWQNTNTNINRNSTLWNISRHTISCAPNYFPPQQKINRTQSRDIQQQPKTKLLQKRKNKSNDIRPLINTPQWHLLRPKNPNPNNSFTPIPTAAAYWIKQTHNSHHITRKTEKHKIYQRPLPPAARNFG